MYIVIDVLGPFPKSIAGCENVLVMKDRPYRLTLELSMENITCTLVTSGLMIQGPLPTEYRNVYS